MTDRSTTEGLIAKLRDAGLDAGEEALLEEVFRRAYEADRDVEGFSAPRPGDDPLTKGLFPSRNVHGMPKGFKGSDEELQIVDWLGTLEVRS